MKIKDKNMDNLNSFKKAYKKAKTTKTKTAIFNKAYLNLPAVDFQNFLKWQTGQN
jgi:hypothetical protein